MPKLWPGLRTPNVVDCFVRDESSRRAGVCTLGGVITGTNDSPSMSLYSMCEFAWQF
jgi:hypothetical protein